MTKKNFCKLKAEGKEFAKVVKSQVVQFISNYTVKRRNNFRNRLATLKQLKFTFITSNKRF